MKKLTLVAPQVDFLKKHKAKYKRAFTGSGLLHMWCSLALIVPLDCESKEYVYKVST